MIQANGITSKAELGTSDVMHLRFTLANPTNNLSNVVYVITHTHTHTSIYM